MERLKDDDYQKKQAAKRERVAEVAVPADPPEPILPAHPCPLCRASGREYSRRGQTWYLKCTACGHTWTEKQLPGAVEIAYRTTEIRTR
jgi:DNA-directed RNA polymerase subunit M/transcription elongation factor TFIIS